MDALRKQLEASPLLARVLPFVVFLGLTFFQGQFGEASKYWVYAAKTVVGAWLVWLVWPLVTEMRWKLSLPAVVTGIGVFAVWVGLDPWYPKTSELFVKLGLSNAKTAAEQAAAIWNPHLAFGQGTALAWLFIVVRIAGSTLVVPPLEEAFYRSFLYRFIAKSDFTSVSLRQFLPVPFLVTVMFFGLAHEQWLAGVLCGAAYQWLVLRSGALGEAMTAHAITNALLGLWVAGRGAWQFW
jgi:hypothetical protein